MATTTNFSWATPDNTAYVKDGASAIRTLGSAIDTRFGNVATYPNQIVNVVSGVSRPLPFAMEANRVTLSSSTIGVTFTAGRFTSAPPIVTVTLQGIGAGFATLIINEPTTTGFNIERSAAINAPAHWIAIQMKSSSGAG